MRSFINNPDIILADEPTGDLVDEETEAEMIKIFKRMNEEKRITFIVVTHIEIKKMLYGHTYCVFTVIKSPMRGNRSMNRKI